MDLELEQYQAVEQLDEGPMGAVYKALDMASGRIVTVKVLSEELSAEPDAIERFECAFHPTLRLVHPGLVHTYAAGHVGGRRYVVTELVDGTTVKERLSGPDVYAETEAFEIARQVAEALQYAWGFEVLHGDVRPETILITAEGKAKLLEMGLAASLDSDDRAAAGGRLLGMPHYRSPELAIGADAIDFRTDMYSLGATLFHLLAGAPPFVGDDPSQVIADLLAKEPASLRERNDTLSELACAVIYRLIARNRNARYATWAEAISDLDRVIRGPDPAADASEGAAAALPTTTEPTYRFSHVPSDDDMLFAKVALRNKMIDTEELLRALDLQERVAKKGALFDLGRLLLTFDMLPEGKRAKIDRACCQWELKRTSRLFIKIVEEHDFATKAMIDTARARQKVGNRQLVDVLIEDGFVRERDREVIVSAMHRVRRRDEDRLIRRIACDQGFISARDANKCTLIQDNGMVLGEYRGFGDIAVEAGYLSRLEVSVIRRAARRHLMTGREVDGLIAEQRVDETESASREVAPPPGAAAHDSQVIDAEILDAEILDDDDLLFEASDPQPTVAQPELPQAQEWAALPDDVPGLKPVDE